STHGNYQECSLPSQERYCRGTSAATLRISAGGSFVQLLLHLGERYQGGRELLFILRWIHRCLLIFERVNLLLEVFLFRQERLLGGIIGGLLRCADAEHGETGQEHSFISRRLTHGLVAPRVLKHGM